MFSSSFDQHVTVSTRVRENTATLIDHIWSFSIDIIVSGVFDAAITNHHNTFTFIPFRKLTKIISHEIRDHSDQYIDELDCKSVETAIRKFHCFYKSFFFKFMINAAQLG